MAHSFTARIVTLASLTCAMVCGLRPVLAVSPGWYNGTTNRGFMPFTADYYQHQRWGPNVNAGAPIGQSLAAWEAMGGWCRPTAFVNLFYGLKNDGFAGMMPNTATANNTWLDPSHAEIRSFNTHGTLFGRVNTWLANKGHGQQLVSIPAAWNGLVYYYYVYFPDAWYNGTPGAPANGFYYRSSDNSWKRVQVEALPPTIPPTYTPESVFERFRKEFVGGNRCVLLVRTLPWNAAAPNCPPPAGAPGGFVFPSGGFDCSLWWRGNGGCGGCFHNITAAGIDVPNRVICFADPDSNKGNLVTQAGINWYMNPDTPVDARKYKPWNGVGDGIPVPTPNPTQPGDPLFYDAYYNCVTIVNDAEGRRIADVAANERYRNVVINQIEVVAWVLAARVFPPPTEGPGPTLSTSHIYDITSGPVASTDEIWFFPLADVISSGATFTMPGWTVTAFPPGAADPQGNTRSFAGLKLTRTSGSPIAPGNVQQLSFTTSMPYDGVKYDIIFRDADDPTVYRPQVYGVEEGGIGTNFEEFRGPSTRGACAADITLDGVVNIDDLLLVISSWGQVGVLGDFDGDGVDVDDLLTIINAWGACP